jgi:hypothetical protein
MIIYLFFMAMIFIGFSFFIYGVMLEYQFYVNLAISLHLSAVVVPIGFYIIIASAMFFLATPIAMLIRIKQSGAGKRFDATPKNKGLFDFIYRDGDIRDVYGDRIPGLGLFRIFRLGLIFDTGREPKPGSVYNIPGKKLRFALQDINFTPNAKFAGFYTYLNNLGFNNMTEVNEVLNGYNPEQMVKIWNIMCNKEMEHPEGSIVDRIQTLTNKDIEKNNKLWKQEVRHTPTGAPPEKQKKQLISFKREKPPISPLGIVNKTIEERTTVPEQTKPELSDEDLKKFIELYRKMQK